MSDFIMVQMDWDRTALRLPALPGIRFHKVHYGPEPEFPMGRHGLAIYRAWEQLTDNIGEPATGMLMLDGDVAIDPSDIGWMVGAIHADPTIVHTAPVKIWPVATRRADWVWSHWRDEPGKQIVQDPIWFGFSFTYLPSDLIEASAEAGLCEWTYPNVDWRVAEVAQKLHIPVKVVLCASPKHMNW
jgi:hypothetical protein